MATGTKDLTITGQVKGQAILPISGQVKARAILDMSGTVAHSATEDLAMSGSVVQAAPEIPTGLAVLDFEKGDMVRLKWTANAETNIIKYNVYYSESSGGPYTLHGYTDGTEYYLGGLTKGTTYYFVITAVVVWEVATLIHTNAEETIINNSGNFLIV